MGPCKDLELLAMPYLDGELATPEMREVELHLRGCESCRCDLIAERARRVALQPRGEPALPPRVRARLASALDLEDQTAARQRLRHGPWILPLLSSVVAVVALLLFLRTVGCA